MSVRCVDCGACYTIGVAAEVAAHEATHARWEAIRDAVADRVYEALAMALIRANDVSLDRLARVAAIDAAVRAAWEASCAVDSSGGGHPTYAAYAMAFHHDDLASTLEPWTAWRGRHPYRPAPELPRDAWRWAVRRPAS